MIVIRRNTRKLIGIILVSLLFLILCMGFVCYPDQFISHRFRSESFIRLFGIVGSIFMVVCLIFLFIKLIGSKPALIVNEEGVIDNSSCTSVGLIKWKDIQGIKEARIQNMRFILIYLYDPNEYIYQSGMMKSRFLSQTLKVFNTPIAISTNLLRCNSDELRATLYQEYEKYLK